jgi:hypothetical protein
MTKAVSDAEKSQRAYEILWRLQVLDRAFFEWAEKGSGFLDDRAAMRQIKCRAALTFQPVE